MKLRSVFATLGSAALMAAITGCGGGGGGGGGTTPAPTVDPTSGGPTLESSRETFVFDTVALGDQSLESAMATRLTEADAFQKIKIGQTIYGAGDTGYFDVVVEGDDYFIVPNGDLDTQLQLLWDSAQEVYYFTTIENGVETRVDFTVNDSGIVDCVYSFRDVNTAELLGSIAAPVYDPPDFSAIAGSYSADTWGSLGGAFGGNVTDVIVFDDGRVRVTDDQGATSEYQVVSLPGGDLVAQNSYVEDETYTGTGGGAAVGDLASDSFDFSVGTVDGEQQLVVDDFDYVAVPAADYEAYEEAVVEDGETTATPTTTNIFTEDVDASLSDRQPIPQVFTIAEAIAGQYVGTLASVAYPVFDANQDLVDDVNGSTVNFTLTANGDFYIFEDDDSNVPTWNLLVQARLDDESTGETNEANPVYDDTAKTLTYRQFDPSDELDDTFVITLNGTGDAIASMSIDIKDIDPANNNATTWQLTADVATTAPASLAARIYSIEVSATDYANADAGWDLPDVGSVAEAVTDDGIIIVATDGGDYLYWALKAGAETGTVTGGTTNEYDIFNDQGMYLRTDVIFEQVVATVSNGVITGGTVTGYTFDYETTSPTFADVETAVYSFDFTMREFNPDFLSALDQLGASNTKYAYEITSYSSDAETFAYEYDAAVSSDKFSYVGDIGYADFASLSAEMTAGEHTARWSTGTPADGTLTMVFEDGYVSESGYGYMDEEVFTLTFANGVVTAFSISEEMEDYEEGEVVRSWTETEAGTVAPAAVLADGYYQAVLGEGLTVTPTPTEPEDDIPPAGSVVWTFYVNDGRVVVFWDGPEESDWEVAKSDGSFASFNIESSGEYDDQTQMTVYSIREYFKDTMALTIDGSGAITGGTFSFEEAEYDSETDSFVDVVTYAGSFTCTAITPDNTTLTASTQSIVSDDADDQESEGLTTVPGLADLLAVKLGYDSAAGSLVGAFTLNGSQTEWDAISDYPEFSIALMGDDGDDSFTEMVTVQVRKNYSGTGWFAQLIDRRDGDYAIYEGTVVTGAAGEVLDVAFTVPGVAGIFASGGTYILAGKVQYGVDNGDGTYGYADDFTDTTSLITITPSEALP